MPSRAGEMIEGGREVWYRHYRVRLPTVEREYAS
jgi:hypothetical protein